MIPEQIQSIPEAAELEAHDPAILAGGKQELGELTLEVHPARILDACRWFRERGYDLLSSITATDWAPVEPRFRVTYHLYSVPQKKRLRLAARVSGDNAQIDSAIPVWPNADWYEREVWDMFGVHFNGHPNLRRILMPDDWEGHPLRKDYPIEGIR